MKHLVRTGQRAFSSFSAAIVACVMLMLGAPAQSAGVEEAIQARAATLAGQPSAGDVPIAAANFIAAFYDLRGHRPAWTGTVSGTQLREAIVASGRDGFRPADFHVEALDRLLPAAEAGDPAAVAEYEVVATDAAIRLLHHLYFGKVNPERLDPDWNFERPMVSKDPATLVNDFVDADGFGLLVGDLALKHPAYLAVQEALDRYRQLEVAGGWPTVPADEVLKPDAEDERVPVLRQRLAVTGDLPDASGDGIAYDEALVAAVKRFQTRHGLDSDGVLGPKTFAALNVPVGARIDQLRLTLERARWILRGLGDEFVFVNIAGAETLLVRGGKVIWRTRSITGQAYRKTPVFRDEIKYMEFNPTWTVPVSIFRKDKLARIRKDPGYLARGGYSVRTSDGQTVAPSSVNWNASNPRVTLVQEPGPKNALGQVKFMFPNKYAVYLHDTDNRRLFDRAERNLSSGCVRLEDPFGFADLLMKGSPDWSAERREQILASGKTTRVDLPRPIPVILSYYTAWVTDETVQFRSDIYDRDPKLLKALNGAFRR